MGIRRRPQRLSTCWSESNKRKLCQTLVTMFCGQISILGRIQLEQSFWTQLTTKHQDIGYPVKSPAVYDVNPM